MIFLLLPLALAMEDRETEDFKELEQRLQQKRLTQIEKARLEKEFIQKEQNFREQQKTKIREFRSNLDKIKEFEKRRLRNIDPEKAELARKKVIETEQKLNRLEKTSDFKERRILIEELKNEREQIQKKIYQIKELKKEFKERRLTKEDIPRIKKRFERLPPQKREKIEKILKKRMLEFKRERRVYSITDPETNTEKKTTEFVIEVPEANGTIEIIEEIPKSVAQNVSQISFSVDPEIIEEDPVVKWAFQNVPQKEEKKYAQTKGVQTFNETTANADESLVQKAAKQIIYSVDGEVEDEGETIVALDEETHINEEIEEKSKQKKVEVKIVEPKPFILKRIIEAIKRLFT